MGSGCRSGFTRWLQADPRCDVERSGSALLSLQVVLRMGVNEVSGQCWGRSHAGGLMVLVDVAV